MLATEIIIKPLLSEKTSRAAYARQTYSFRVDARASKPEIKAAIEELYKVNVVEVRTMVRKGKTYRTKTGIRKDTDIKRALVKVAKDQKIELF
jgi:large subunit ribosomal protein L23